MKIVQRPSPNSGVRPPGVAIDAIVLHATADTNTEASVAWCQTPKPKNPNPVSYHEIIDRDGTVFVLVPIERRAWHAGVSAFEGRKGCNDFSIGISFANRNDGKEAYTELQYQVGAALCATHMRKHPAITLDRITTHRAVALPPGRKTDPLGFDMAYFKSLVARELKWGADGQILAERRGA